MASQGFSFPPPPPPPPPQHHAPGFQSPAASYGPNNSNYSSRGGRPSSGHNRGRGRGNAHRGGRGGHFGKSDSNYTAYRGNPSVPYGGYPAASTFSSPSTITYQQSSQYQPPQAQSSYASPNQPYSQASPTLPPYSSHTNYNAGYGASSAKPPVHPHVRSYSPQSPAGYAPALSSPSHSSLPASHAPPGHPAVVAPPMRWGYNNSGAGGFYADSSTANSLSRSGPHGGNVHSNSHPGGSNFTKQGHKRAFSSAFEKPSSTVPRVPAPPPVPSFGNPLPAKPPAPVDAARKQPKKRKRRFNQLGLTPKTEEHESSEEEDDVDEEARLARGSDIAPLQISYRGRTSTLQSPAEIAAWIEERKKRFPTQTRIEEKKKAMDEIRKQRELQREEALRQVKEKKERAKSERKEQQERVSDPIDAAVKAKLKAERLRKKLAKEERRVAKAEADAERARLKAEALQQGLTAKPDEAGPQVSEGVAASVPGSDAAYPVLNGTDGVHAAVRNQEADNNLLDTCPQDHVGPPPATVAPAVEASLELSLSHTSDEPSSDGSDLASDSDDDSDDSDGDSAPEEVTSRRDGPERVPPPPRETQKRLCRHFARTGRCSRGDRCRFAHERPEGGAIKVRPGETKGGGQPAKRGLFQLLLAREAEERDRRVMQAIIRLGEEGLLDEPISETGQGSG